MRMLEKKTTEFLDALSSAEGEPPPQWGRARAPLA